MLLNHSNGITRLLRHLAAPAAALTLLITFSAGAAHADRRYFTYTYSPFLGEAGELEVETWLTARTGKSDPAAGTEWLPRAALEYALHDRFGTAAYLNLAKQPGRNLEVHSTSVELIYRLANEGRIPGDPALYLEAGESGDELELESKLLLARRFNRWFSAVNLVGDFEFRHDDAERLASGEVLRNAFAGEISGGAGIELTRHIALGLETRFLSEHPNFGRQSAALLSVGPTLSLRLGEVQLALGVQPQVWGSPRTNGTLNLNDFEKAQIRVIAGFEL